MVGCECVYFGLTCVVRCRYLFGGWGTSVFDGGITRRAWEASLPFCTVELESCKSRVVHRYANIWTIIRLKWIYSSLGYINSNVNPPFFLPHTDTGF